MAPGSPSITEAMHRALLPPDLPVLPDLDLSAAYLMMPEEQATCGDWFDAVTLPNGCVALAVGDVVGDGPKATAAMGRLRAVTSEFMIETSDVVGTVDRLDHYAGRQPEAFATTVCVGVLDPLSGGLSYATAGHPPPVLVGAGKQPCLLPHTGGGPLGTGIRAQAGEARLDLGDVMIMFTNGLVARPSRSWSDGMTTMAQLVENLLEMPSIGRERLAVDLVCQTLIATLGESCDRDDGAVLAAQRHAATRPLDVSVPAEPAELARLRAAVHRWTTTLHLSEHDQYAVEFVISEAAANSIDHGYRGRQDDRGRQAEVQAHAGLTRSGSIELSIDDRGAWVEPRPRTDGRGLGLSMIEDLTDDLLVTPHDLGTTVTMSRRPRRCTTIAQHSAGRQSQPAVDFGVDVRLTQKMIMVHGPIDLATDAELDVVLQSTAGTPAMTIDLSGVTHLASAGVRVLHRHARRAPETVFVVRDSSPVAYLLDLVALPGLEIVIDSSDARGDDSPHDAPGSAKTGA